MISLILPYWDRQEAADKALALLEQTYAGLELEVVVVDDGNPVPFRVPDTRLDIKVVRLAEKAIPKCPTTAWNAGVKYSSGDIIVLSCIEVLHEKPVLAELAAAVRNIGPLGYVLAAAWCPESGDWHCHSTVKTPRNPWGTGIAFCGAMHRELYDKAGGFDEDYREGAGYEDNDFINRMLTAGARFVIRDDLVVTHPKTGASIQWGAERFARNEALYYSKWPTELKQNSITFCCVQTGDYLGRGREYVENLYGMLKNCLPDGLLFKFVCFTDEPFKHEGIECRPAKATGWDAKIALFSEFEDGERIVYFDLDTVLIGRLDAILGYQGEFATLRDFYREGLGPAVMLWRAGFGRHIWTRYEEFRPSLERGDQEWLERVFEADGYKPAILQDIYPGLFCSYKKDCNPSPPKGARVVCFHGVPRPHEVEWAARVWRGEVTGSEVEVVCNTDKGEIIRNMRAAAKTIRPWVEVKDQHEGQILLVGGGPSTLEDIGDIRIRQATGAKIMTMNGTAALLRQHGIMPDMHIIIDARRENIVRVCNDIPHYFASQCHPDVIAEAKFATLFHIAYPDIEEIAPDAHIAIGGGHSVGLYAMSLAYVLGFRDMHVYGYDSSYKDGSHHAYAQKINDSDEIISAFVHGREYKTTSWMVVQVQEFKELAKQLADMDCKVTTHGTGLLQFVAWQMMNQPLAA